MGGQWDSIYDTYIKLIVPGYGKSMLRKEAENAK
jgi:hypothetical protein